VRSTFTKRRRLISTEFELKLAAPAAKLEKLKRALLAMPTVKSEVRSKLVSTYYDTPTLALHRERLSFRVRKQGPEFVQTAKAENPAQVDMLERREWEDHIPGKRPVLDAPKTGKRLPDTVRDEELRPVFTTTVTRTVIEITPDPSARIEAAVDEGEIRTSKGDAVAPISEIELELKNGDPRVIFDVALQLHKAVPIRIETRSKAERGYRLLGPDGLMPQAVRVGPVALDPAMSVEAALERIGRRCLTHLLSNEQAALAGEPEGIHQMRVSIRRLRSALLALKRPLQKKHYRWASGELRWLAHTLGPVRNWDIFAACLVRPVTQALPAGLEFGRLIDATEPRRRAALDQAKQAIMSERYTESMLRLLLWFAAHGWRDQQISEHAVVLLARIVDAAPDLIERHHRKARKRSKQFEELTASQRHRLRIALKNLHYIIEFLGSLFDKGQVRIFAKCLTSLRDDLGHASDVRVAYDLMDQFREATDPNARTINRSGGIVLGWHERGLADHNPTLRKHVRRLRRLDPFW
jgi:inorganic triphosphatase YgiF